MKNTKLYGCEDLSYSLIYGSGIYEWDGNSLFDDPFTGEASPVLKNVLTGETFFARLTNTEDCMNGRIERMLRNAPLMEQVLWPLDLVQLTPQQAAACRTAVSRDYCQSPRSLEERTGGQALLFSTDCFPPLAGRKRPLSQECGQGLTEKKTRQAAVALVRAFDALNRAGYLYPDVCESRIFLNDRGEVVFDFSNLICVFSDSLSKDASITCAAEQERFPAEFAEPAVFNGEHTYFDFASQNYSLCAYLFFLLMGRYCYDGRLMRGYQDFEAQEFYVKFRAYHKMAVFLFDPEDTGNALGAFFEEQSVIDRWEDCPPELKELFLLTLTKKNARKGDTPAYPTPGTWLRIFEQLGWTVPGEETEGSIG